jgi:hypothetical protein
MPKFYFGALLGHTLSKVCQYLIIDDKIAYGFNFMSIKFVQVDIHKCITWPKIYDKGR